MLRRGGESNSMMRGIIFTVYSANHIAYDYIRADSNSSVDLYKNGRAY